jgi:NitT/TauT family transport system permease protein
MPDRQNSAARQVSGWLRRRRSHAAAVASPSRRRRHAMIAAWAYPTVAFIGFLLLWQLVVVVTQVKRFVLPQPLQVLERGFGSIDLLLANTPPTVLAIALGFVGAMAIGIPLAVLMVASRALENSLYPLLVGSQGVPKVALAPVLVVWFGFGVLPKVIMAMLIAFFPIVINTAVGLRSIDPNYLHLVRSMGAPAWRIYMRLLLPSALPQIFAGLKVAMALAIVGAIVGEMVGANSGLGYLLVVANGNLDMPLVFAVLVWLVLVSLVLVGIIDIAERLAIPWSRNTRSGQLVQGQS